MKALQTHPIREFPHATYCADGAHSCSRLALCIIKCHPHAAHQTVFELAIQRPEADCLDAGPTFGAKKSGQIKRTSNFI